MRIIELGLLDSDTRAGLPEWWTISERGVYGQKEGGTRQRQASISSQRHIRHITVGGLALYIRICFIMVLQLRIPIPLLAGRWEEFEISRDSQLPSPTGSK
jgi:hypothetical protein